MSSCFQPQVTDQKLSGQRAALERGQNPLPLYLSLNVKENHLETLHFKGKVLPTPSSNKVQLLHTPSLGDNQGVLYPWLWGCLCVWTGLSERSPGSLLSSYLQGW